MDRPSVWWDERRTRSGTDEPLRGRTGGGPDTCARRVVRPVADSPGGGAHSRRCGRRAGGARSGRPGEHRAARERRSRVPVPAGRLRARAGGVPAAVRQARRRRLGGHPGAGRRGRRGARGAGGREGVRAGRARSDDDSAGNTVADPAGQQHVARVRSAPTCLPPGRSGSSCPSWPSRSSSGRTAGSSG